jgi:chemotaxis signal transduction protein
MIESLLMISVQSQNLFVHARMVQEILGEKAWIPIPGACKEIPGVVQWNRRAVAMLDLGRVVADLRPLQPGEKRPRTLMLRIGESNLALPTDAVSAILEVDATNIRPRAVSDFLLCRSEVLLNDEVTPLLEPAMLLHREGAQ